MTAPDLGITDEAVEAAELAMQFDAEKGATYWELAHAALVAAVPLLRKAWEQERGQDVYAEVRAERERAHRKHGETSMESSPASDPTGRRYRVLAEEVGEVAREFNDAEHDHRPVDLAARDRPETGE